MTAGFMCHMICCRPFWLLVSIIWDDGRTCRPVATPWHVNYLDSSVSLATTAAASVSTFHRRRHAGHDFARRARASHVTRGGRARVSEADKFHPG